MNSSADGNMTIKTEENVSDTSQDYLSNSFTDIKNEVDGDQSITMKIEFDTEDVGSNNPYGFYDGDAYPNYSKENKKCIVENGIESEEDLDPIAFIDVSLGSCEEDGELHFDDGGNEQFNPIETENNGANSLRRNRKQRFVVRKEIVSNSNKTKEVVCKFCNVPFKRKRELDKHISSQHVGKDPYQCNGCDKRFSIRKLLRKHKCKNDEKSCPFECSDCGKRFSAKKLLRTHLLTHNPDRPHACSLCGKSYKKAYDVTLHMKKKHLGTAKVFKCDLCDFTTKYRAASDSHRMRHSQEYKYRCEICNKGFSVGTWLAEHKNLHTGEKPFECDICNKRFFYSRYLNAHKKYSHPSSDQPPKVHECETCGKTFAHRKSLGMHIKSHTGENVYLCDICGKALSNSEHLKFHRRIHTGEKPNICKYCGKGFAKSCNLTLHLRVHTGERPYKCEICGKAFSQRSTLVIHNRYHTGQRPYSCQICGKSFVCQGLLSTHIKKSGCDPRDIEQYCRDSNMHPADVHPASTAKS